MRYGLLIIATFFTIACNEIKPEKVELEPTTFDAVLNEVVEELEGLSMLDIEKNQMVRYELNLRAEMNGVMRINDTVRTVVDKAVSDSEVRVTMKESVYTYNMSGNDFEDIKHSEVVWAQKFSELAQSAFQTLSLQPKDDKKPVYKYYNLRVTKGRFQLPESISSKPDCAGFEDCRIPARRISYIMHTVVNGEVTKKEQYRWTVSREIPPLIMDPTFGLPPVLDFCIRDHFANQILRTQCLVLRDIRR